MGSIDRPPAPSFKIGPIPVYGHRVLAPMDGMSDLPFRSLSRSFGSAISYTPFVSPAAVLSGSTQAQEALAHTPEEHPLAFQLFDDNENRLREAALRLLDYGPDFLDINMGCSARCVAGRGAGAGLLRDPAKVGRIVQTLSAALPIPVTAKIRLGWDDASRNYLEIARIIEDSGAQLLAVHGRTKQQGYTGAAAWEPIGEVKAAVSIPVIGNGDVRSSADADRLRRKTGCDAVMIGRGAVGNPWIFLEGAPPPTPTQVVAVVRRHLEAMLQFYGEARGTILFRKHLARYLDHFGGSASKRKALLTETDPIRLRALVDLLATPGGRSAAHPVHSLGPEPPPPVATTL